MTTLTFIDLFCGIGGFHQALVNLKYKCVFACDIDNNCRETYFKNYGIKPEGDICQVDILKIPKFDILCGGFPCNSFSKAGFQKGLEDTRGTLFFNICEIVKVHKPKYMILENVKNLVTNNNGHTWGIIMKSIDELGYITYTDPLILNVLHFNIPQNRERVIILCKRKDILLSLPDLPFIPKTTEAKLKLTKFIKDIIIPEEHNNKNNKLSNKMKKVSEVWSEFIKIMITNKIEIPKIPLWSDWFDIDLSHNNHDNTFYLKYKNWIDKNILFYNTNISVLQTWLIKSRNIPEWSGAVRKFEWQAGSQLSDDNLDNLLWSARGSGIRVKRPNYIPTLVAMSMIPVYKSRYLGSKELLKLQSFPDNFQFDEKNIFKQIGNAVNVKMIERCADFLINGQELFIT